MASVTSETATAQKLDSPVTAAIASESVTAASVVEESVAGARPIQFPEVNKTETTTPLSLGLGPLMDVNLRVSVKLGETTMTLGELLKLGTGSVIELNTNTGGPIDILVNNRLYAQGEVVVVDEAFGVRIMEVVHPQKEGRL